jgi:putative Mn2+ efflux pump MntP
MLFAIAAKMLYEAYRRHPGEVEEKVEAEAEHLIEKVAHVHPKDPTKGWSLLFLAVATSLDALVVGFSLGLKEEGRIWLTSVVIGLVAAGMSLMGVMVGRRVGGVLGPVAETIGALVLIGLGVSFLLF